MTFIDLVALNFKTRCLFFNTMININGETLDCKISIEANMVNCHDLNGKLIVSTYLWNLHCFPTSYTMFILKAVSECGGDAVLIIPDYEKEEDEQWM